MKQHWPIGDEFPSYLKVVTVLAGAVKLAEVADEDLLQGQLFVPQQRPRMSRDCQRRRRWCRRRRRRLQQRRVKRGRSCQDLGRVSVVCLLNINLKKWAIFERWLCKAAALMDLSVFYFHFPFYPLSSCQTFLASHFRTNWLS